MKSSIAATCILMVLIRVAKAEVSPSLSPWESCSTIIYDMIDCIPFLSGDSTEDKPTVACCSGFKIVVGINAECICEALKSSVDLGADINLTKAAALPSACQVSAPPISECNLEVNPPPPSESPIPISGPAETPAPAGEVAKHAPSPSLSGTCSLSSSFFLLFTMLLICICYISV
ncbi:non-specific lipid transfer protein GPI-anchored 11-like [Hibiscus syriacus]|uniref:non-specific lipid transfer protein GPI-anchored 11-like n=1 Tax=Hibiscus syriacus TaxID=106335 RepID=UPI0019208E93|nr:non-specific lipid transfer protein GPI-anchored 11-like [Hibiscus syriacus]